MYRLTVADREGVAPRLAEMSGMCPADKSRNSRLKSIWTGVGAPDGETIGTPRAFYPTITFVSWRRFCISFTRE